MPSSKWKSNFREVQEWLRWHSVCPRLKAKDCSEYLVIMWRSAPRVCSCSRWPLRALWATATSATASAATWTHRPRAARRAPISCCHEVVGHSRNKKVLDTLWVFSYKWINLHHLHPHRAAADPEGGPEHCGQGSPSTLQSPGGGCFAVTPSPLSPGPQEAEEQPLSERGTPEGFADAARQTAEPWAQTRDLGR